jgi:hypothetical protein
MIENVYFKGAIKLKNYGDEILRWLIADKHCTT